MNRSTLDPIQAQSVRVACTARLVVVAVTIVMLLLLARVAQLQIRPAAALSARLQQDAPRRRVLARRGALLDRKGRPLAATRVGYRLYADPQSIGDPLRFAAQVARAIDDDPTRIDRLLDRHHDRRYLVIHPLLSAEQLAVVRDLKLEGLVAERRLVRLYPQGGLAGAVLGMVGVEHDGLDGLEYALDSVLAGQAGHVSLQRDARRRPMWIQPAGYRAPTPGRDVRLSLDAVIQAVAETELDEACRHFAARRGEVVVMDATTGQLLAMANWPPFDPNGTQRTTLPNAAPLPAADPALRRNRCVTDPYEPGSVFKPFVHAAATARGLAGYEQLIDCTTSGVWVSGGRRLRDSHAHGEISWADVLVLSSNIGMGKVGRQLGRRGLHAAVSAFGFGRLSGGALPGESRGILSPVRRWTSYSLTSIPMGQEIAVTPVQLAKAFSAFANGGLVVVPSILGDEAELPRIHQRALAANVADQTRQTLRRVVTEGTGRRARSDHYRIWGKTGTAQVPDQVNGGYAENAYTASFLCGAPLERPRVIVVVSVHQPEPARGYYGGTVAAPVARKVIEQTLHYLGVPEDAHLDEAEAPAPDPG
ncbi:MAG: penicillin-binding protein 2 [Phycisphaerae bacterium]|nr:penicillin-binding protein 2 [Phycisphaerae bacterium]